MKACDIAVAGCGPAGLAAALLLARDGHRITLFERFETVRPLGSGLMIQPTGLAVLRALGLERAARARSAPIARLFGVAEPGGRTVLDVRYASLGRGAAGGLGMHRAALFDLLHRAVREAGIDIETGRTVAGTAAEAHDRRSLVFAGGARAGPFDLVVDAQGTSTPLAPNAGRVLPFGALWTSLAWPDGASFDKAALEQRYVRASIMAGVLPLGAPFETGGRQAAFFWSLRTDHLDAWRRAGLECWKDQVRALWPATAPLLDQIDAPERLTFARYSHRTVAPSPGPGLIHVGDAWHSASPQLGQGANMALLDTYGLALALRETNDMSQALARVVDLRRRHVALYQAMSAMFTPVYQSDSRVLPFVRDRIVGPISKLWPATAIQAAMVSGLVGRPLRCLGLSP